jgi:hypothetical protein
MPSLISLELAPFIKDDVLSKRAKNMTEFKKYVKQSERQFEVLTMIHNIVLLFLNLFRDNVRSKDAERFCLV